MVSSSRTPDSAKHRQKPELDSLSAKRLKDSASGSLESLSHPESDLCDDDSSKLRALSLTPTCSSSCRDFKGPSVASRCQVNGDADAPSADTGAAGISYPSKNHNAHVLSDFVTGWMYLNEQGQMCGPYIQQQLIEGLSTGFLPDELPVYPFMNGALLNPVPLKFFKQYPDHIGTGFTYVARSTSDVSTTINCHVAPAQDNPTDSVSVMLTSDQQSHINQTFYNSDVIVSDSKLVPGATFLQQLFLSWEERCWSFVDDYGRSSGPHSLSELYGWHQYSYLHSSVMIRHINNSCCPFTLLSLINAWRKQSSTMTANENSSMLGLISGISEEIGTQLHDGIIKAARRSVVDEIIGNVIVDFAATKKAQKQSKSEHGTEDLRSCLADSERSQANAEVSSSSASHAAIIARHDVQTSDNLAKKILEESCNVQNLKSIGSIENFKGANKAICQVLFDHCMQVIWNAVFIEPVTSYALTWRKNKRWTHISIEGVAALDKINTGFQKTADVNTEVRELGTLADKLDCPPGFSSILQDSLMISHSYARAEKSPNPDTQHYDDDLEGMTARVEEELHISGKASMDDFLKIVVEKEVSKAVKCLEDGPNEVAAENLEILCNDNDSEDAASRIHQELGSGHICLDEAKGLQEVTISSVEPALSPQLHSSSNFIGFGLRNLGVSSNLAIKSSTDDPPPVGFTDVTNKPCAQDLCKCLLDQFESPIEAIKSRHAVQSARECSSSNFTGSAFKILGMPVSCVTEDQKTDEPLILGSGSEIKDVVSSITSNLRPSGLDETIPNKKKFAGLALCRKKLHDDVLREWISTFHDTLKRHALFQEDVITRSDNLPNSTPPLLSHIDRLMERSKSCHSSGPPEVSVIEEITYSRRKKVIKKSGAKPSFLLRDSKIRHQPVDDFEEPKASKKMSCSGTLGIEQIKQKAKALCQQETGSSTASKVGAVNRILSNDHQLSRLSNGRKLQSAARPAQKYCAERRVSHMETASSGKVVKKDKRIKKSSTTSSLKRKDVVDESPSLPPKAPKIMDADAKQAALKKDGRTKLNKSKVPSSCPLSDGCARTSVDGWKWHKWSLHARPAERARVKGNNITTMLRFTSDMSGSNRSRVKGISARTNRVKMRNLLAAVEGAELLKTSQLKTRKKRLRFQRSKIHAWGLVALEPIEPDDFVIEYVGELIRPRISDIREQQYEKMGIGSSYLFRLDDGYVVDATTSGGLARFINHSCEPNCYTKIVSVEGQKRIFIYAKRHISAGEEITYNYKFPLEEKKIPCNCGSKRCRGSMN